MSASTKINLHNIKKRINNSKSVSGFHDSNVANAAIRNVLSELSKEKPDAEYFMESITFFENKCPYTGEPFKSLDDIQIDHIVPANKEYCGLSVKGNLVFVTKSANYRKGTKDYKKFINGLDGVEKSEKTKRINKIKAFQRKYHYNPDEVARKLKKELKDYYEEIKNKQSAFIEKIKL